MAEDYKVISNKFRRFCYRELEKATCSFKEVIGQGRSGVVYKEVLDSEIVVAVKKLKDVRHGKQEFWGEVSVIGRIYHMNLVRTSGFCSEDHIGFWVIHCDVKPENILLDCNYETKIADFGLAKLLNREMIGSNVSRIRGTRGYIAPEWASNLPITGKIDVYGYGVVLLELMSGSRVSDLVMKEAKGMEIRAMKRMYLMLMDSFEMGIESWVASFIDSRLKRNFA